MKSLISCHRGVKESKNEYRHLSILKSLSSHNDNWGFFIPRNKALTTDGILLIGLCTMFLIPVAELCLTPDISLSFMRVIFYPYLSYIIVVYCLLIKNKDIFSSPFTKLVYYVSILGFVLNLMQIIRHMYLYG